MYQVSLWCFVLFFFPIVCCHQRYVLVYTKKLSMQKFNKGKLCADVAFQGFLKTECKGEDL